MSDGERRLAAIMFTDMVGYTALGQRNESLSLALVQEQRKLIRPILSRHNGREIKTMGDAFLVEFPNALDAVRCAYDIQRATREFDISLPEEKRIHLRVGLHLGDVVESQGDISGDAVNVASRIEHLAEDGGVCLTRQVYDHVSNKFELPLSSLGRRTLKNVSEPLEVFKMTMPWEKEGAEPSPQLDPRRLAILPFVSMSPDSNDEYFADGLTEELITRISLVRGLEVIARTSAMNYKKEKKNASQIGKELKVGTLLEGSVRKAGNRIRVSAQLINANTEGHLWAESYDRNLEDIFEVQSSVAENVAGALKLRLLDEDRGRVGSTADLEAYTIYLRAMQLFHEETQTSYQEAIALFKDAISKDPTYVRAYAGLAYAWWHLGSLVAEYETCISMAEPAARKALELGPESADAHLAVAVIHTAMDRANEAVLELEKAIRINPNLVEANTLLGQIYTTSGRFDEAIGYLRKAGALDPLNVSPAGTLILTLRVAGKVNEALEVSLKSREQHMKSPWIYLQTSLCYLQKKDFGKALESIDIGLKFNPDENILRRARGMAYAMSGEREAAMHERQDLMKDEAESHRLQTQVWIGTALGELDEAFKALMREADIHSWWPPIKYDPLFEGLQKDPRFPEFCKKVGLPP